MREFQLDARLEAIERMIPACRHVADIGCDHGRLGAKLLLRGKAERVTFMDISQPSLDKARALTERYGLEGRAEFLRSDGARGLPQAPDSAVIAGMGGETIAGIVEAGKAQLGQALLVMQPNVAQESLRRRLAAAGYMIVDEQVAREGRRWYVVIAARPGVASYNELELLAGPVLCKRRGDDLLGYAQFRARVSEKALAGARGAGVPEAEELARELSRWREILAWRA